MLFACVRQTRLKRKRVGTLRNSESHTPSKEPCLGSKKPSHPPSACSIHAMPVPRITRPPSTLFSDASRPVEATSGVTPVQVFRVGRSPGFGRSKVWSLESGVWDSGVWILQGRKEEEVARGRGREGSGTGGARRAWVFSSHGMGSYRGLARIQKPADWSQSAVCKPRGRRIRCWTWRVLRSCDPWMTPFP